MESSIPHAENDTKLKFIISPTPQGSILAIEAIS